MKRILIALLLCLMPVAAMAAPGWERNITAEWGYDAPADLVLTGFRMYQEGVAVCDFAGPDLRTGTCNILLLKRSTPFTLTAVFSSGEESPHSDAYALLDWGPKPRIIRLESR